MSLNGLTLDQLHVFVAVAEEGSFSATARRMNRSQSAVTYAVQKMEQQLGISLFDRSSYRPIPTAAGTALLPAASRIVRDIGTFNDQSRGIAQGLEPELCLVIDAMFPMQRVVHALHGFGAHYPTVPTRIYAGSLGAAVNLVIDGTCAIGLTTALASQDPALHAHPIERVRLVGVVAPCHPLAAIEGAISTDELQQHVQLVLTDHSGRTANRDNGVLSGRNWRLGDLGAKHAMLLGGLGWGGMPLHLVEADLASGRLRRIHPEGWRAADDPVELQMTVIYRKDRLLGPAARWLTEWLMTTPPTTDIDLLPPPINGRSPEPSRAAP